MAFIGWILVLVGGLMVAIAAFRESILWGIGALIIPFVGLIFVATHWQQAKTGFLIQLGGLVLTFIGGGLSS